MTIATIAHHRPMFRADVDKALGVTLSARSVLCPIASPYYDGVHFRAELAECKAEGRWASVWMSPDFNDLTARTVDLAALPDHEDVEDAMAAIESHGDLCALRICFEFANKANDGGYFYKSPDVYVPMFDAIAEQAPENAVPSFDYEPSANLGNIAAWRPKRAKLFGVDLYGTSAVTSTSKKGAHALVALQTMKGLGLAVWCAEAGFTDAPDVDGKPGILTAAPSDFFSKLLSLAALHELLAVPITSDTYGGYPAWKSGRWAAGPGFPKGQPDWPGNPAISKYLTQKIGSVAFAKTVPHPLAAVAGHTP